jgi:integrase
MRGCRPLTDQEVAQVLGCLKVRDKALFTLGIRAGFRISELLSIRVGDVIQNGSVVDRVTVQRRNMKGKKASRNVILHPEAKAALILQINNLKAAGFIEPHTFLFLSRQGENKPLSRFQAWAILKQVYASLGMGGKLGTHAMRKTFAKRMHAIVKNDLIRTQQLMGHTDIKSTMKYLSFNEEELDEAILKS